MIYGCTFSDYTILWFRRYSCRFFWCNNIFWLSSTNGVFQMMCPSHQEFYNEDRYMIVGDETYEFAHYNGRDCRLCKDCIKKLREKRNEVSHK